MPIILTCRGQAPAPNRRLGAADIGHRARTALSDPGGTLGGMTRIALFHSVLGVRRGVIDAADILRSAGHDVLVVDQYSTGSGSRRFDDYDEANRFAADLGFPQALMASALAAIADEPGPLVAAGFSNGAGMAEYVTAARGGRAGGVVGSVQFAGALPLTMMGLSAWPADTPAQLHYATGDPMRSDDWIRPFVESVEASGSRCETFLDYSGGHLFTDRSLPGEFDEAAADLAFERALDFLARIDQRSGGGRAGGGR